jgi:limonene-1,2-epoxide hydrolase
MGAYDLVGVRIGAALNQRHLGPCQGEQPRSAAPGDARADNDDVKPSPLWHRERTMPQRAQVVVQRARTQPRPRGRATGRSTLRPPYAYAIAEPATDTTADQPSQPGVSLTPTLVVERFLDLLRAGDIDGAAELLGLDVEYTNVGLPTVRGRERVRRLFRSLSRDGAAFDVYVHAISADGPTVLTERTDVLKFRRLSVQLWVCGRFDVRDAQIVVWRDYFDYVAFALATLRGVLGVVFPALRAKPPSAI